MLNIITVKLAFAFKVSNLSWQVSIWTYFVFFFFSNFDETIDRFDAYKVETIGDAYMVVSGLPQKNNGRHVVEVALLSLELLRSASDFTVPHMPEIHLKLRIGLHSGEYLIKKWLKFRIKQCIYITITIKIFIETLK